MLNHTYTSVNNANLVDCGAKQHISSQPSPLWRDNFLGEFRTELDKKKVLANLGIATSLSLEWEYIKGDIGRSESLMQELDSRTTYISKIDNYQKTLAEGLQYLESVIGGEQDAESEQNERLELLEQHTNALQTSLGELQNYLKNSIEVDINKLDEQLQKVTENVNNITNLIQVSSKENNALSLLSGEEAGLYVPDLSTQVNESSETIKQLSTDVSAIQNSLDTFVTKEELGGGDFDFVNQDDFDNYVATTNSTISDIKGELENTVKTGEDGHVDTLYVNTISKNNDDSNIKITDSFEVQSGIPLDVRCVVENLEELLALPARVCYPGMGVIVNSLSALYILRNPENGVQLTQEYISDVYNWKCPEDLVTVALTREDYEALDEINPNVFYYIYEEEVQRTKEPNREDYDTEEEFQVEWQKWVESLKILSQEYMSASWGIEMEDKLGKKASQDSVAYILTEIEKIKGSGEDTSLESLNSEIQELHAKDESLTNEIHSILDTATESGRLVEAETRIKKLEDDLPNYITEDELTELSGGFDFVKPEIYEQDKKELLDNLAASITTSELNTNTIKLSDSTITYSDGNIALNDSPLAKVSDVPVIKVLSQTEYDALPTVDEETYYYTYDGDTIYVTKSELDSKVGKLQQDISALLSRIQVLEDTVSQLQQSPETPSE